MRTEAVIAHANRKLGVQAYFDSLEFKTVGRRGMLTETVGHRISSGWQSSA
jgi:hypothetical protein